MWMGTMMEPTIGALFQRRNGILVERANIMAVHDEHPFASASPDFWIKERSKQILETKYTTWRNRAIWDNGIPDYYAVQLNWQLGICELARGNVVGLVGDDTENLRGGWMNFSAELFDYCLEKAYKFLLCVRRDIPPEVRGDDYKLIVQLQGERVDEPVDLEDDAVLEAEEFARLDEMRKEANANAKRIAKMQDDFKSRLVLRMGNKNIGVLPDGSKIQVRKVDRAAYTQEAYSYTELKLKKK